MPLDLKTNHAVADATKTVVIVDDAMLARSMLVKYIAGETQLASIGQFASLSELAAHNFREAPCCLVVSIRSSTFSDQENLSSLAKRWPQCFVLMLCHATPTSPGNDLAVEASFRGRCGKIACKPEVRASEVARQTLETLRTCLPKLQAAPVPPPKAETVAVEAPSLAVMAKPIVRKPTTSISSRRSAASLPTRLIVIGGSTGAPAAVTKLLQQLPADFPLPIAISLHMLEDFTGRLAQSLDRATKLRCTEAKDNELLQPATVYIAKGDHHLTIEKNENGRFLSRLNREPPEHFARPSVNQLFRSAAIAAGPATVAVMMTGIGSDGLEGTEMMVQRGGLVIAQDELSSTVWGMPAAVVHAGLAREVLNPGEAGQFIARKIAVEAMRQKA